jgi:hypothetical protein
VNRGAVLSVAQATVELGEARRDLSRAMGRAHDNKTPVPCREDPDRWTHDGLLFGGRGLVEAEEAIHVCRTECPVIAECAVFLKASVIAGVALFGVVAGELTSPQLAANARRRYLRGAK